MPFASAWLLPERFSYLTLWSRGALRKLCSLGLCIVLSAACSVTISCSSLGNRGKKSVPDIGVSNSGESKTETHGDGKQQIWILAYIQDLDIDRNLDEQIPYNDITPPVFIKSKERRSSDGEMMRRFRKVLRFCF
ncbi:MAG: hypothetical protein Q4C86_01780 [bacterium]|nr:hypothetical protein [bacterium]